MQHYKKIRVLECIRQGQVGGGESHLLSLVENLDRTKFEPVVLSFTDGPMIDKMKAAGISCHVIQSERPLDFTTWRKVKSLISSEQIDLVHAHGTRAASNIMWAAGKAGKPLIYTIHGWSFHDDQHPLQKRMRILMEQYITSKATRNITVSVSNHITGQQNLRHFSSITIKNGIDIRKFDPSGRFTDIRKEIGIDPDTVLLVFVARFTIQKQPLTLINAYKKVISSVNKKIHLLMVGSGDQRAAADILVAELGLAKQISFLPFREDVPSILSASDIFILPSLWEGLPIGLLEAMAMNLATICTSVDGTKEVITHNQNGLLVKPGDTESLAQAMITLVEDTHLRTELGRKAGEMIAGQFNATRMTKLVEDVYHSSLRLKNKNEQIKPLAMTH